MLLLLDGERFASREQVHWYLAEHLGFPAWYGHNMDALYDCLTERAEPTELVLLHWTAPALLPLRRVMEDAAGENGALTVTCPEN